MYRAAIYFAPRHESDWWSFGSRWLGRDPATAIVAPGWSSVSWRALVAEPARYGWHATLKAPFEPAAGVDAPAVEAAVATLARRLAPVALGALEARHLGSDGAGFVALVPAAPSQALVRLAAACVTELDPLRAPLSDAARARRDPARLDARGLELLEKYGYPNVLERFRFHMTLTGPVPRSVAQPILAHARAWVERLQHAEPLVVDRLCVFVEEAPGAPFERRADFALGAPGA